MLELEVWKPGNRYPMRSSLADFLPDVATTFGGIWQSCHLTSYTHAFRDLVLDAEPGTGRLRISGRLPAWQSDLAGTIEITVEQAGQTVAALACPRPQMARSTSRWTSPISYTGRPNSPPYIM